MLDLMKTPKAQPAARMLAQTQAIMKAKKLPKEWAEVLAVRMETPSEVEKLIPVLMKVRDLFTATNQSLTDSAQMLEAALTQLGNGNLETEDEDADPGDQLLQGVVAQISNVRAKANPATPRLGVGQDWNAPDSRRARMADGLYAKLNPDHVPTMGREIAAMSLGEIAVMAMDGSSNGVRFGGKKQAVMDALHSTSDFSTVLGNTVGRRLMDHYEAAESGLKSVSREISAPDFRQVHGVRLSGSIELEKVNEGGEFKYGTLDEGSGLMKLHTYGKTVGVSRQVIVNDDIGAFENIARIQGEGASLAEGKILAGLLAANGGTGPVQQDGIALFHADHNNIAATGSALDVNSLGAARLALRRQKGLSGEAINVVPVFLIVPPELETLAEKLLAEITAHDVNDVNPFAGKLTLIVDAHLTSPTQWYVSARPGQPDGLQHAYLDGAKGPQFFTQEGFHSDGMQFKVRLDFGANFVDHRAWYMNPGE